MKKLLFIALLFSLSISAQDYVPLHYFYNGTPANGIKIKTNLPYSNSSQMPTIIIEGYNYGKSKSIGIIINWYIYKGNFYNYGASSHGAYAPPIQLANENGKVVIFLDSREYFNRFQVRAYAKSLSAETATNFQNWSAVDETLSGTNIVTVPYRNTITGDLEIHGAVNIGGTQNKSLKVRHINGKDASTSNIDNLYLNYGTGKDVWIGKSGVTSNLITYGRVTGNSFTSKSSVSIFSNEAGEASKRLTINTNDADNTYMYNYDESSNSFHTINLGGRNSLASGLTILGNGNVAIGTATVPNTYKLAIAGKTITEEVKIQLKANWPDFVFNKDYQLPTLNEVEEHINRKGHLPNIPSAKQVKKDGGIELGEMNRKLLQKIEELTLYTIQQQKKIKKLSKRIEKLEKVTK